MPARQITLTMFIVKMSCVDFMAHPKQKPITKDFCLFLVEKAVNERFGRLGH